MGKIKLRFFPQGFFSSKPVRVILLFCLGVGLLSRCELAQENSLMMSWDQLWERFPKLPSQVAVTPPSFETGSATNLLLNPKVPGTDRRALEGFFSKLEASRSGGQVKVLYYGDSIIWGDNVTKQVRKRLLEHFPNGGRGLIPVINEDGPYGDYVLGGLTQTGSGWKVDPLLTMRSHEMEVGVSLRKYTAVGASAESHLVLWQGEYADSLGILATPSKASLRVEFVLTNNERVTRTIPEIETGYTRLTNRLPWREARILASPGAVLFGYEVLKTSGVVFGPVIRKGICAFDFLNIEVASFRRQLADLKPDLLIWHYGKNEAGWDRYHIKDHLNGLNWVVSNVRAASPETELLLVGPGPRMNTYGGPLRLFPSILEISSNQEFFARELGLGYFDSFTALGGADGFNELIKQGLAMTDFVHLTVKGGDYFGDILADNLLIAWSEWFKSVGEGSLAGMFQKKSIPEYAAAQAEQASSTISFDTVGFGFFLIIVFFVYWFLFHTKLLRIVFLLLASWFFYMTWNPVFIILIIVSSVIDYLAGFLIFAAKQKERSWQARLWLVISLSSNLGLLFFFKYFNFFADFLAQLGLVEGEAGFLSLILPAGISFYTFQTMSYSLDIYRGLLKPIRSFVKFNFFVSFFPQLVAGPIVRAREFLPQVVARPRFVPEMLTNGFFLIMVGLFKKIVISDFLAINFADRVFASPGIYTPLEVLLGVYAYGLQIYCDFSGYSDIAIGVAALFGFKLPLNFNSPYKAHNLQDFWHRWHITLSTWLRDYLYIPLGGNRKGSARTYINLAITMLLGGLWHGAAYRFIVWGALHGLGLGVVRWFQRWRKPRPKPSGLKRFLGWAVTINFVMLAWIFFRAPSMEIAGQILGQIASLPSLIPEFFATLNLEFSGFLAGLGVFIQKSAPNLTGVLALVLFGGYLLHFVPNALFERIRTSWARLPALVQTACLLVLMLILYQTATAEKVPFIYFQF